MCRSTCPAGPSTSRTTVNWTSTKAVRVTGAAFNVESSGDLELGTPYAFDTATTISGSGDSASWQRYPWCYRGTTLSRVPLTSYPAPLQVDGSLAGSHDRASRYRPGAVPSLSGTGTVGAPDGRPTLTVSPGDDA